MLIRPDMIRRNIGKKAVIEADAVDTVHLERLGGYLHHHVFASGLHHALKALKKLVRFRCRVHGRRHLTADHNTGSADHPHLFTAALQNRLYHMGRRRLPLRSCYPYGNHLLLRPAKPGGRQKCQRLPGTMYTDGGYTVRNLCLAFHHQGLHPGLHHIRNKFVGIDLRPLCAHEHHILPGFPGIIDDILHFDVQIPGNYVIFQLFKPLSEFHENLHQNNPVITPSLFTSILLAAGTFGRPGMVMIAPVSTTTKPAPADT